MLLVIESDTRSSPAFSSAIILVNTSTIFLACLFISPLSQNYGFNKRGYHLPSGNLTIPVPAVNSKSKISGFSFHICIGPGMT